MDGSWALAVALGHVRNAVVALVAAEDSSGESLFLAAECLDLEGLFAEFAVEPALVNPGLDASESLEAASAALASVRPVVPLALWAELQAVRSRAVR